MAMTDSYAGQVWASTPVEALVTNFFLRDMPDLKNNAGTLLPLIEKRPMQAVSGRWVVWPATFGRNTGVQNLGYGGAIPQAGRQSALDFTTRTRQGMGRIAIDGVTYRHAKTNGGAFVAIDQMEMTKMMDDMMVDRARQVHGDGSGRLAEVVSEDNTNITLKVNSSIEGAASIKASGTIDASGWLDVDQRVAFVTSAGTIRAPSAASATVNGVYIKTITASGDNVVITVALTPGGTTLADIALTAGDWMVRAGAETSIALATTSFRVELTGIGGILSDADVNDGVGIGGTQQGGVENMTSATGFQGQASTVAGNAGVVLDNGGAGRRPNSYELMLDAISDAERLNNANITLVMSGYPAFNDYAAKAVPDKRYNDTTVLKTGQTEIQINGLPWVKDRFHYQNCVSLLALDQIELIETQPITQLHLGDMTDWERVIGTSGSAEDKYWRGWVWEDQIRTLVRQRAGARLTELSL